MASIQPIFIFFFNDTATTEIYTLSLHDALPICPRRRPAAHTGQARRRSVHTGPAERGPALRSAVRAHHPRDRPRSEEHTSELQSRQYLVCRLLLEKKKQQIPSLYN